MLRDRGMNSLRWARECTRVEALLQEVFLSTAAMHESAKISYSSQDSLDARKELFEMMGSYPSSDEEKERSLGLFLRGSLLARILATGELYQKIIHLPGIIVDLGTWRGQTAVLCENFRAIYEPLHFNRRILCLDTFDGYRGFTADDKPTPTHRDGTYVVGGDAYAELLKNLLVLHERNNAMGHCHGKHKVIKGDCRETLPAFFREYPNEIISLAFFDLNSFDPTLSAFNLIYERLVPGGVIAFWQLTRDVIPAEARVYAEHVLNSRKHELYRTDTYPGLCYLIKK